MDELMVAPKPEIHYINAIFRDIMAGKIKIPAFQRNIVWDEKDIISLLDSIYKGYPIGSLLFWQVDREILKIESQYSSFPDIGPKYPLNYVLDGMQRLSSLYNVFHNPNGKFAIYFDLEAKEFLSEQNLMTMPLSILFNPKSLFEFQRQISVHDNGDELTNTIIKLQSTFQEYLIPIVIIKEKSIDEVVEMFERINNNGVKLGKVDFMRALTWSVDFDLNSAITEVQSLIYECGFSNQTEKGFSISDETIVKSLALCLDIMPEATAMLKLRTIPSDQLKEAINKIKEIYVNVIEFCKNNFKIFSYDFIPYEGQVLILFHFFLRGHNTNLILVEKIKQWFWSISLCEGLQGKPDTYLVRLITEMNRNESNDERFIQFRFNISEQDIVDRKFIKNKALSCGIAGLFAVNNAMPIISESENPIPPEDYMKEFQSHKFSTIVDWNDVKAVFPGLNTQRFIPNMFVITDDEYHLINPDRGSDVKIKEIISNIGIDCLKAQFIDEECLRFIKIGAYSDFFARRTMLMMMKMHELCGL